MRYHSNFYDYNTCQESGICLKSQLQQIRTSSYHNQSVNIVIFGTPMSFCHVKIGQQNLHYFENFKFMITLFTVGCPSVHSSPIRLFFKSHLGL